LFASNLTQENTGASSIDFIAAQGCGDDINTFHMSACEAYKVLPTNDYVNQVSQLAQLTDYAAMCGCFGLFYYHLYIMFCTATDAGYRSPWGSADQ
jgi:hypothetical protein